MKHYSLFTIHCSLFTVFAFFALTAKAQFSSPKRAYLEHIVTTDHADRIYKAGEEATVRVEAFLGGNPVNDTYMYYKMGDEMMPLSQQDSVRFVNGTACIKLGTKAEPGFRACQLHFTVDGKTVKDLVKVGYSPNDIRPLTEQPKDFDKFWKKAVKEAQQVALNPEITPLPQYSTDKVEVSLVKLNVGKNGRHFYGYLTKPKDGKKHPVLFCPPGAGANKITPTTYYSDRGYIYLNICIHNDCNPELSDSAYKVVRKAADNYERRDIGDKNKFYYRQVYAGCTRCIDFLCSLPEWDGLNVGVTGGSQGGALTIVTSALSKKVTFCAPFYPALSDLTAFAHGRASGWPNYFRWGAEPEGTAQTVPYYDVANFARRLTCPVFFSFGFNDETCSPTSTYADYNVITAPKTLVTTPTSGHWRYAQTNDECMEWMKRQ